MGATIKKNVLLYLGKFPGYGFDIDGGSILAKQLIDTLKNKCYLDVVFIRKNHEEFSDESVRCVRYVKYKDAFNNKFTRRLENLDSNLEAIGDYSKYDIIITAHVSKFFGLQGASDDFWQKTILFPMFCTSSYIRAGEKVPAEYTNHELYVFQHVGKIICPSIIEKNDIIKDYNISEDKIVVIPRGVAPIFTHRTLSLKNTPPNIICVGSIKRQKNNLDALKVLALVRKYGIAAELHLVCTIQDNSVYTAMLGYIKNNNLQDYVKWHTELSQKQVAELMSKMNINISVSNWETFGRGIFEGISSGLPTFVYSHLIGVQKICMGCIGVSFCSDAEHMAKDIVKTLSDKKLYATKSESLKEITSKVSYYQEQLCLLNEIIPNK